MKEIALKFGTNGSLIGVLSEECALMDNSQDQHRGTAGLLFNAGLIHHIGPNRFYVKLARMADMGLKALRFDFSGIGDSGLRMDKIPADESMLDEARHAMDFVFESRYTIRAYLYRIVCRSCSRSSSQFGRLAC